MRVETTQQNISKALENVQWTVCNSLSKTHNGKVTLSKNTGKVILSLFKKL